MEKNEEACSTLGGIKMKQVLYFFKQLYSYTGKKIFLNLLGMAFIGSLDGVALLLLVPVISYSGMVSLEVGDSVLAKAMGYLQQFSPTMGLSIVLAMFLAVNILQNIIHRIITIKNVKIQHDFSRYLRVELYRDLLNANWEFYLKRRKSDLINTITADLARVSAGTNMVLQLITSIIFTTIQIILAYLLSPHITFFVLISGCLLAIFSRGFIKRSNVLGSKTSEIGLAFLAGITDNFNGIKEIKSNSLEQSRMTWYQAMSQRMYDEQMEYITLKTSSQFYYKIASAILIAIFIFLSVSLFQAQSAQLMLVVIIFMRLWPRVTAIQSNLEQIATVIPSLQNVINLKYESQIAVENHVNNNLPVKPLVIKKGIELNGVYYRYQLGDERHALNGIDVTFPANKMTAIVGKSGAGKSTLIDTLMGLLIPESGQVSIDGEVFKSENIISLRESISYVPQDPFLFNGTIRDNLSMFETDAGEEQFWTALEFSAAAEFVRELPKGLDTIIGDRGIRLSGGERQRLVLARAVLRNPKILILDEATSSLDTENEKKIQEAIERLKGKMTIIVIAHRLSTIRNADQVIVLERGEVIQIGGFDQLAQKRGMFRNLLGRQLEVEQLEVTQ
jgi:ABC-type multidrug transport system fused ATPase/permease subunit